MRQTKMGKLYFSDNLIIGKSQTGPNYIESGFCLCCRWLSALLALLLAPVILAQQAPDTATHRAVFQQFKMGDKNVKTLLTEQDSVWIGSSAGLIKYSISKDDYEFFNNRNGLRANGVFSIDRIDEKRVAIGTYGGGLAILDETNNDWQLYSVPDGLGDPFVYDVLKAKNGDIWIATWTGVNRVVGGALKDKKAWELHTLASTKGGLPNDWVYGLAEGQDGVIWLATEGGLARFEKGKWQNWNHKSGIGADYATVQKSRSRGRDPADFSRHHAKQKREQGLSGVSSAYNPNYVVSLAVDGQNQVWVGTWGAGLSFYDGKKWETMTELDGLPSNLVYMLRLQGEFLWIGTSRGLVKYHLTSKKMKIYTKQHGLFADTVFSMDIHDDGSLWIGSFGGVSHIGQFPSE